ncbi:MAG: hypothetical protein PWR27_2481, partial [Petroclostridium sp.]|nr:hypothetical protein [Petroclostridium sp.]
AINQSMANLNELQVAVQEMAAAAEEASVVQRYLSPFWGVSLHNNIIPDKKGKVPFSFQIYTFSISNFIGVR